MIVIRKTWTFKTCRKKAQKKFEVIVDCAMPCKFRKIPESPSSKAAKDPDETLSDEHGQREILRTTNVRWRETVCACICESFESMGKRTKESPKTESS